jgi:ppGpp synthetase/RelA/SpoT-type nucleotidyltranferase
VPSKRSLRLLGRRLAHGDATEADQDLLNEFILARDAPMERVSRVIRDELGYANVPRLKTRETLVQKLERGDADLPRMDDIAGVRLSPCQDRTVQDNIVSDIRKRFGVKDEQIKDRRVNPSFGYRAVHLIVRDGEFRIEVQVRTLLQHRWAEIYEKFADLAGRGLRYGESSDQPRVARIQERMMRYAEIIDSYERGVAITARLSSSIDVPGVRDEMESVQSTYREIDQALHAALDEVHGLIVQFESR